MLRRINFISICLIFGVSVLLIIAGNRYTDNTNYQPIQESHRNVRDFLKIEEPEEVFINEDVTTNVQNILEKTRSKIKSELANYNFSRTKGEDSLDKLLLESGGQPLRNLIVSTWRSGTTFLGELINAIPGTYYHYEPLLRYGIIQIRGPPHDLSAVDSIKKMMACNYEGMDEYFTYGKSHLHQFSHNTKLWEFCKIDRKFCFDADFTSKFCKLFPFQTMKIVRLRLRLVEDFLKNDDQRVKVVFLVRDPRGVMQSRQHRDFCQPSPDCWQPELLCADMVTDYATASYFVKKYPKKFMVLRYEDLALNPNVTAKDLLKFLGLSVTPSVDEFLQSHTNVKMGGVSSTFRVSKDVPFRWKNMLDFDDVEKIQYACTEAMHHWGYKMAYNASHMQGKEFEPLEEYSLD